MKRSLIITAAAAALTAAAVVFAILLSAPPLDRYEQRSDTAYDSEGNVIYASRSADGRIRIGTRVQDADPLYLKMLLASEDARFYDHFGVDAQAVLRALAGNVLKGRTVSGASTIAMQVCRLLQPKERTLWSKIREAGCAVNITLTQGRERVLDMYLTLAPFGGDLEGLSAASYAYFNKPPKRLRPEEAALLTALPRSPERIRPDRNLRRAERYRREVLRKAAQDGIISRDVMEIAARAPLPQIRHPMPQSAYHLGVRLFAQARGNPHEIRTTIDPAIQSLLNETAENFARDALKGLPLEQTAMVAIDNETFELKGYVGSSGSAMSYTDLGSALRSPGSALKPFAYGMAFERDLLHPASVLMDQSHIYDTYQPRNYDRRFFGEITAASALQASLNLPALEVMRAVGADSLMRRLNGCDGTEERCHERIVLPAGEAAHNGIVLGACGISLTDLTLLYAALSNDGIMRDLRIVTGTDADAEAAADANADATAGAKASGKGGATKSAGENESDGMARRSEERVMRADAARAVMRILQDVPYPSGFAKGEGVIAHKTGTSFKYRDTIAVGSAGNMTVGILQGRADNAPSSLAYSAHVKTAPLLFSVLTRIPARHAAKKEIKGSPLLQSRPPAALTQVLIRDVGHTALRRQTDGGESAIRERLRIAYPSDGMTVRLGMSGRLFLKIEGGRRPYTVRVDGIVSDTDQSAEPKGYGVHTINVTDATGESASVSVLVTDPSVPRGIGRRH